MASLGQGKINEIYDDEVLQYIVDRYHKTVCQYCAFKSSRVWLLSQNDTHRTYEGKSRNVR